MILILIAFLSSFSIFAEESSQQPLIDSVNLKELVDQEIFDASKNDFKEIANQITSEDKDYLRPTLLTLLGVGSAVYLSKIHPKYLSSKVSSAIANAEKLANVLQSCDNSKPMRIKKLNLNIKKASGRVIKAQYYRLKKGHWALKLASGALLVGGLGDFVLTASSGTTNDIHRSLKDISIHYDTISEIVSNYDSMLQQRRAQRQEKALKDSQNQGEKLDRDLAAEALARENDRKAQEEAALKDELEKIKNYDPTSGFNFDDE